MHRQQRRLPLWSYSTSICRNDWRLSCGCGNASRGTATKPAIARLTGQQRRRMILMLRAFDGHQHHATYRELAATLLDPDLRLYSRRDWLISSHRSQIIRLVKDAIERMEGGYRELLSGP